jgi:hypothetical protein
MYLYEGEVNPQDEETVIRYEKKILDQKCNIIDENTTKLPTKEEMSSELFQLENSFNGYWCEGEKCGCSRKHWVVHASKTNCWDCMHDPGARSLPLV